MLSSNGTFPHHELTSGIILSYIHRPFHEVIEDIADATSSHSPSQPTPTSALWTLITLVSNTDPSPLLITALLSPITPVLYSLFHHMEKVKSSNPDLRESLRGLLITLGKIVGQPEGLDILWHIIESNEGGWHVDLEGHIHKLAK
jgi:hypothetical protein